MYNRFIDILGEASYVKRFLCSISSLGMYHVVLEASNLVSTFTTTQDIYVQEYIEGFHLLHDIQPVVPGQPTIITWTISHGTDVTYTADLGMFTKIVKIIIPQLFVLCLFLLTVVSHSTLLYAFMHI